MPTSQKLWVSDTKLSQRRGKGTAAAGPGGRWWEEPAV